MNVSHNSVESICQLEQSGGFKIVLTTEESIWGISLRKVQTYKLACGQHTKSSLGK